MWVSFVFLNGSNVVGASKFLDVSLVFLRTQI